MDQGNPLSQGYSPTASRALQTTKSTLTGSSSDPDFVLTDFPVIPGYEIVDLLGEGGPSVVYKARTEVGQLVALKMLKPVPANRENRDRFFQEAAAMARVRHRHVVTLHHWERGGPDGWPFFTMPIYSGGSLARQLPWFRLDLVRGVGVMIKVAEAVGHLHAIGMVHRDLKPHNVLLDDDREPYLSDFGLVKWERAPGELPAATERTITGSIVGTVAYMAPEQARGEKTNPRGDVWSLGVMLFELLVGRRPYLADGPTEMLEKIRTEDPPAPRSVKPEFDAQLERIILKCLARDAAQRYASASMVADDLRRWFERKAKPVKSRRRWVALIAGGLILIVVLALLMLFQQSSLTPEEAARERQRILIERLARGESVELIGDKGAPAWGQVVPGTGDANTRLHEDGTFTVFADTMALFELLSDVRLDRYRFTVQVRQNKGESPISRAGIFFGDSAVATASYKAHSFIEWSFTESHEPTQNQLDPNRKVAGKQWGVRECTLKGCFKPPGDLLHVNNDYLKQECTQFPKRTSPYEPFWEVGVEVEPTEFRLLWEGGIFARIARPLNELSLTRMKSFLGAPDEATINVPEHHGALGLFVNDGSASFRRARITPLDP